jgi:hypothetical protein
VLRASDRGSRQGGKSKEQGVRAPRYRICFWPGILYLAGAPPRCGHPKSLVLLTLFPAQTFVDSAGPASFETPRSAPQFAGLRFGAPPSVCACRKSRLFAWRLPVNAWPHVFENAPRWDGDGEHGMAAAAAIFPQHFICAFYSYNVTTGIILPSATVAHEVTRWPRGVLSQAGFSARARLDDSAIAQHQPLERTARATLPEPVCRVCRRGRQASSELTALSPFAGDVFRKGGEPVGFRHHPTTNLVRPSEQATLPRTHAQAPWARRGGGLV